MKAKDADRLHVLVIASSAIRRAGLADMVTKAANANVTTASSISSLGADVIVVDIASRAELAAVLRATETFPANTGVVLLSGALDSRTVATAVHAGVLAILPREVSKGELGLAIAAARAGLALLPPDLAKQLIRAPQSNDLAELEGEALTSRELEVLRLLSDGLANKHIASRLQISQHTVKFHISSILGKLGATSRTEAVSQGIRRGLISI